MSQDYNEVLCQAVDIIVNQRISELKFDETIVCTIIDNTNRENGEYVVTQNGQLKFKAYSEYTRYLNEEQVYIHIPKDSTQKRLILGRYINDLNNIHTERTRPSQTVVQLGPSITPSLRTPIALIANSPQQSIYLTTIAVNPPPNIHMCDTLCIRANFKCLLDKYSIRSGSYGVRAALIAKNHEGVVTSQTFIQLDSAQDMFGNPYAYNDYNSQEQTYKISLPTNIIEIEFYAYQKADFKYGDKFQQVPEALVPNIFIKDIEVFFAYEAASSNNMARIHTNSVEAYNGNLREIELSWYNHSSDNRYLGFNDGQFDQNKSKIAPDEQIYYSILWYALSATGSWSLIETKDMAQEKIQIELNPSLNINRFKAEIWRSGQLYTSNTLNFYKL